jgi:hypothetical protein
MLDFESGYMSFSINGSPLGSAFSEDGHGSNPQDDSIIPDRFGPSWESGFFPAITIGIDQSVIWNLGQAPFRYAPVGFQAVANCESTKFQAAGAGGAAAGGDEPKDCTLPYEIKQYDPHVSQWIPTKYGDGSTLRINPTDGFFCYLQPSMRINFSVPVINKTDETLSVVTICSSRTLRPNCWTHCAIQVNAETNEVQFFLNEQPDTLQSFPSEMIQFNTGPVAMGVMPSKFMISDYFESHVWMANIQWSYTATAMITLTEDAIPFHQKVVSDLVNHFTEENNSAALVSMKELCLQFNHPLQPKALEILLSMASHDPDGLLLEKALGLDGIVQTVVHLLEVLESTSFHKQQFDHLHVVSHYMRTLSSISQTSVGRAILIKLDIMIRLIALLPLNASSNRSLRPIFFWAEICLSNLHIPLNPDKFEEYLDRDFTQPVPLKMDDWIFFKNEVQPFCPLSSFPSAWEHMPLGIWVTFLDLSHLLIAMSLPFLLPIFWLLRR